MTTTTSTVTKVKTKYTCPKCGKTSDRARNYRFFIDVTNDVCNGKIKDGADHVWISRGSYGYGEYGVKILLICWKCYKSTTLPELDKQRWRMTHSEMERSKK